MELSSQEYGSGQPSSSRGDLPDVGIKPWYPAAQETQVQSLGWEDSLEKEMATHSSILAWKISWREEPGGLQSMGVAKIQARLSN